jgi:asparagine synthase (glutamine-hydrolysing)
MCGILGGINYELNQQTALAALSCIAHRGPDDQGIYLDEHMFLAHRRLSIQDLSMRGHQPMSSADGRFVLIYNGELYNHLALRAELSHIHFNSASDTETLLQAFMAWGPDCLQRLDGIFAFAIYDRQAKRLFLARDAMGVKPLYYYFDGQRFAFASELKAIVAMPGLDLVLKPEALLPYAVLLWSPEAQTPFKHIQKLLPGHCLQLDLSSQSPGVRPRPWYRIPFTGRYEQLPERDWILRLDQLLQQTVSNQLVADVPVGFMLSGGLDSSLLAALVRHQQRERPMSCFTIDTAGGMRREGFDDDLPFARQMAQQLGARLELIPAGFDLAHELDTMIWQLEEPQADAAAFYTGRIAGAASRAGFKVLLSGAGADDLFSGYRRHQSLQLINWLNMLPQPVRRGLRQMVQAFPQNPMIRRLRKLLAYSHLNATDQRIATFFWTDPGRARGLFTPDLQEALQAYDPFEWFRAALREIPAERSSLNQMLFWEQTSFLPHHNFNYTDKMGMAHGVEIRVPYAGTDLAALAACMPPELKLKGNQTKYLLRRVAAGYLPPNLIKRAKTGFGAPVRAWMQGPMRGYIRERLLDPATARQGLFNPQSLEQLITDTEHGRVDGAYTLFSLLSIESWLRQFGKL